MAVSRRAFLQTTLLTLISLPLISRLGFTADDLPFLKDGEDPGKALKYCSNADKPTKLCSARKAKEKAKQYCYNCQLFTKTEGEKKAAKGKCMVIAGKRITGAGWCMSWVQNPTITD